MPWLVKECAESRHGVGLFETLSSLGSVSICTDYDSQHRARVQLTLIGLGEDLLDSLHQPQKLT